MLEVSGEMQCNVIYKDKHYLLPIVVVNYSAKPRLLGKNWVHQITLAWGEILSVSNENPISAEDQLSNLLSKYHELFTDSYEGMKGLETHITMKSNVKPIFLKAHRVPYALNVQAEKELDKPEAHGVIKKTDKSSWASPIVVVPKSDNTVTLISLWRMSHMSCPLLRICILLLSVQRYLANSIYHMRMHSGMLTKRVKSI